MKDKVVPLCKLNEGEQGEIAAFDSYGSHHCHSPTQGCRMRHNRMSDMGLHVGKKIQLLRKQNRGPILLKVDQARIAIGRGLADKIWVKNPS